MRLFLRNECLKASFDGIKKSFWLNIVLKNVWNYSNFEGERAPKFGHKISQISIKYKKISWLRILNFSHRASKT